MSRNALVLGVIAVALGFLIIAGTIANRNVSRTTGSNIPAVDNPQGQQPYGTSGREQEQGK